MQVRFGKYKGCDVAELIADQNYCRWLLAQDWFEPKHPALHRVVIQHYINADDDDPEYENRTRNRDHAYDDDDDPEVPPPHQRHRTRRHQQLTLPFNGYRALDDQQILSMIASWPRQVIELSAKLARLPIRTANGDSVAYYTQSYLTALDTLQNNLFALKALDAIVYEMAYHPTADELHDLTERALEIREEFYRLRQTRRVLHQEQPRTPRLCPWPMRQKRKAEWQSRHDITDL